MNESYNVAPRYTPGSPALVERAIAERVAREEREASDGGPLDRIVWKRWEDGVWLHYEDLLTKRRHRCRTTAAAARRWSDGVTDGVEEFIEGRWVALGPASPRERALRGLPQYGKLVELIAGRLYTWQGRDWGFSGIESEDLQRYLVIYRSGDERSAETYDTITAVEEAAQLALFEPVPFVPDLIIDLDTNRYHGHSVQIRVLP